MSDQKDTIYIDVDDEITGIIDKATSSKKKVIALVLPKRATVMQSIVNMKLLKRACDNAGKSVVLITSEAGVLPLAATVGLYVAKTLQSKPFIPADDDEEDGEVEDSDLTDESDPEIDETKPIGELAGEPEEEAIEVDNEVDETADDEVSVDEAKPKPTKKNKKLKIPNFDSFRKKLFIGIALLLLLAGGWYYAFFVMPTAKITLKTDTTTTTVDMTVVADPAVKTLDVANKVVPAITKESKKTSSQKVSTTGEKNLGEKAEGKMTVTNCIDDGASHTVPAGTTFTSGQFSFVTKDAVTLDPALFSGPNCKSADFGLSKDVDVTAAQGGDTYNLSSRGYSASISGISGFGSNMTGGTNKIVKIVAQEDLNSARNKALEQSADSIKAEIAAELAKEGYVAIPDTFGSGEPVISASPAVGAEANEVTVTVITSHTMLGVERTSIKALIEAEAKKQIDTKKQTISDDGINGAVYQLFERKPNGQARLNIKTNVTAGPQLKAEDLKKQLAGKRRGEIQQILNIPGVKDVDIKFAPFWVTKTPTKLNKITIIFENEGK